MACPTHLLSTYVHELIHWKDAEKYRTKKPINNQAEYINAIRLESKKKLDKLIEEGYNINNISEYASKKYMQGAYDETWTEYRVQMILERREWYETF